MAFPWEDEEWYKAHSERWKAMEAERWEFSRPTHYSGLVGLTMKGGPRGAESHTFYIKSTGAKEAHSAMLQRCEAIAKFAGRFVDL